MGNILSAFTSWCWRESRERTPLNQPVPVHRQLVALVGAKYGEETRNSMLKYWKEAIAQSDEHRRTYFLERAETSPQGPGFTAVAETREEHLVGFVAKLLLYAPTEWYEVLTEKPLPEGVKDDFAGMGVAFDASSRLRRAGVEFYHKKLSEHYLKKLSEQLSQAYPSDAAVFYIFQGKECRLLAPQDLPNPAQGDVRVVAASDTHLYQSMLKIPPGDIFVHAGDLCYEESRSPDAASFLEHAAKHDKLTKEKLKEWKDFKNISLLETLQWFRQLTGFKHKVLVGGNHDFILEQLGVELAEELCKDYGVTYLHTSKKKVDLLLSPGRSVSVWGSGVSTQKGLDATQAAISGNCAFQYDLASEEVFRQDTKHVDFVDILVTHAPPLGSLLGKEGKTFPTAIRELITRVRPQLYICGHAHNGRDLYQERWEKLDGGVGVNACCLGVWNQQHGFPIVVDIEAR